MPLKIVCVVYLGVLTFFLLVEKPAQFVHVRRPPSRVAGKTRSKPSVNAKRVVPNVKSPGSNPEVSQPFLTKKTVSEPFSVPLDPVVFSWLRRLRPVLHFLGFVLATLLTLAARWPLPAWAVLLWLGVYATGTELLQWFVPQRTPDLTDLAQNMTGILVGAILFWLGWGVAFLWGHLLAAFSAKNGPCAG